MMATVWYSALVMATKKSKWVVYEFRDGQHMILSRPQVSRGAAEKLREQMNSAKRGRTSLGVGRVTW